MTVPLTKARILDILETRPEIKRVVRGTLRQTSANPAFVVFSDTATHEKTAADLKSIVRDYRIIGLIKPMEEGRETEAEQAVEPFYNIIESLFDSRPGLWLTDNTDSLAGIQDAYLVSDSGFQVIILAGAAWAGCEWVLRVEEFKNISQGA